MPYTPPLPLSRAHPMVKRLLAATFPEYTGRKVAAAVWAGPRQLDAYWSEGSRSYYRVVRIQDGAVADLGDESPFLPSAHEPFDLPAGQMLVERRVIGGREAGITVWARPEASPVAIADRPRGIPR